MDNNNRELYDKYDCMIARNGALIEWLCMRHAWGDTSRCAELRQECYISLWKYLPTLREETNVFQERAWVVLHCRSVFSHLAYRRRTHQFLPLDDSMADTIAEPDNSHLRDTIDTLAALLTPYERRAFYLMADGYSAEDMARELGIKHRSAVLLRHRIIKKLRNSEIVKRYSEKR